ncbi:hypothetical protein BGX34_000110, partial [Mortierella sp. NVP85]
MIIQEPIFCLTGSDLGQDTDVCEEEMNMYLSMEKEESPEMMYNESLILKFNDSIQKTAVLSEKESCLSGPSVEYQDVTHESKVLKALKAVDQEVTAVMASETHNGSLESIGPFLKLCSYKMRVETHQILPSPPPPSKSVIRHPGSDEDILTPP